MAKTHGMCHNHPVRRLYVWSGFPRLRDAVCPACRQSLERTASNLLKPPYDRRDEHPLTAADGDGPRELRNLLAL